MQLVHDSHTANCCASINSFPGKSDKYSILCMYSGCSAQLCPQPPQMNGHHSTLTTNILLYILYLLSTLASLSIQTSTRSQPRCPAQNTISSLRWSKERPSTETFATSCSAKFVRAKTVNLTLITFCKTQTADHTGQKLKFMFQQKSNVSAARQSRGES